MDANVVRTLNQGPMGPQGPVKKNYCIMNQEAGFEPVVRIYDHKFKEDSSDTSDDSIAGAGEATLDGGGESMDEGEDNTAVLTKFSNSGKKKEEEALLDEDI